MIFEILDIKSKLQLIIFQFCAAIIVCLANFNMGGLGAYPTNALSQWRNETNPEVKLDDYEGSLFASLFWMVGVICSPFGGILSSWLGRRKIVIISAPFVSCGWLVVALAQNKMMLYVGRIISSGTRVFIISTC